MLAIDAEHRTDASEDGHVRSRRVSEQVRLPGDGAVLADETTASYTNGVLEVHLPVEDPSGDGETTIDID